MTKFLSQLPFGIPNKIKNLKLLQKKNQKICLKFSGWNRSKPLFQSFNDFDWLAFQG